MKAAVVGALFLLVGIQSAEEHVPIQPRVLLPSATRLLGVPPFSYWSPSACDKDGNMYFHVGGLRDANILRLSSDGTEGKSFRLSDQLPGAAKAIFGNFSVTPGGTIYVFAEIEGERKLLRFDGEGAMMEPISLHLPRSVVDASIVASDTGTVLFFGYYDETAPASLKGKSYQVVLEPSGMVRKEVHVTLPGVDMAKWVSAEMPAPGAALGEDGNFYLAGSRGVLVISQDGELVRRIPFDNPDPESLATNIQLSGGLAVIDLSRIDNLVRRSYLVLETTGGEVVGFYKPSEQLGGSGTVCFSRKQGLTFIRFEKGQTKLLTAPLQ